jgi:uncharacterized protein (TIGR02266 family)
MGENQRRFKRKTLEVTFRVTEGTGAGQLEFQAADISAKGTFLKSELLLEEGDRLSVEFRVPGVARLMRAHARVVWVRRFPKANEPAGMGLEFLAMSEEDTAALLSFLAE